METPVIINCVVGGIMALATIVIAGATVVNMKINKSIKEMMKTSIKITKLLQEIPLEYTLYKYGFERGLGGMTKKECEQEVKRFEKIKKVLAQEVKKLKNY